MKKLTKLIAKHKAAIFGSVAAVGGFVWYRRRQSGTGQTYADQSYAPTMPGPDLSYVPGGGPPVDSGTNFPNDNSTSGLLSILEQLIKQLQGGKKHPKPKPKPKPKKHPGPKGHHKPPRSHSHTRAHNGGRTKGVNPGKKVSKINRGSGITPQPRLRHRPKTGGVSPPATTQHPHGAMQPGHRTGPTPQHRPSSPPARTGSRRK